MAPRDPLPPDSAPAAIHAPWRMAYLEDLAAKEQGPTPIAPAGSTGSFLADNWLHPENDQRTHVIARSRQGMILLNAYPYATGHLLVALGEARPTLLDYSPAQRAALWRHVDCAAAMVQRTFEPQGINIGVNQGRAAGAGVPSHLHVHLVPRWGGDVNFITAIGQIRVIPASIEATSERYRTTWTAIGAQWQAVLDHE